MMQDQNIVCFAKDWTEDPTSNNHVMKMLARDNEVLWLNSISTRTPNLASGSDLKKIGRKLASFAKGPVQVEPRLSVYTPIVLPFPHSKAASQVNARILRASVGLLRRRRKMADFQLWTFIPTAVKYAGKLGESLLVYYCTDEWSQFDSVDGARMSELEGELCRKADLVFTTSRTLLEKKKPLNPETHLASHGVDHAHFAAALDERTPVAEDMKGRARPVLGFFGLIESWIDVDLFAYLAEKRPAWTIAIVGKSKVDVSKLERYPNVVMTGRKPYEELPRYCKGWDVALCPFVLNELTRNVNPIKLREYLSAGLPVVSTGIPEMLHYPDWCYIANEPAAFLAACERALAEDSPARRRERSDAMKAETWEARVAALGDHVLRVRAASDRSTRRSSSR
jgi:glycosyltransferase involved in cell wall biosynthesis